MVGVVFSRPYVVPEQCFGTRYPCPPTPPLPREMEFPRTQRPKKSRFAQNPDDELVGSIPVEFELVGRLRKLLPRRWIRHRGLEVCQEACSRALGELGAAMLPAAGDERILGSLEMPNQGAESGVHAHASGTAKHVRIRAPAVALRRTLMHDPAAIPQHLT